MQRFEDARVLTEALLNQFVVNNDGAVADDLYQMVSLKSFAPGDKLIIEGSSDNEMYFILAGHVSITIKEREVARRGAGHAVGEMALIDTSATRSASVTAIEQTVVAIVSEANFSTLASKYPVLWRRLALALGQRIRERGSSVRMKNETPRLFIGSSVEGLSVARSIQSAFSHDSVVVEVWTDDIFQASKYTIESLTEAVENSDFAVLVISPDDKVKSRGETSDGPRDNVIFELGLFMGSLGRDRVFFVKEQKSDLKIPTDLLGITPLEYKPGKESDLPSRVAPICSELRKTIKEKGAR